jgi:hypothetical protein
MGSEGVCCVLDNYFGFERPTFMRQVNGKASVVNRDRCIGILWDERQIDIPAVFVYVY